MKRLSFVAGAVCLLLTAASPAFATILGNKATPLSVTDEGTREQQHLKRNFPHAANVKWSNMKAGQIAYFESDGTTYRVYYDKRGNWTGTVKTIPVSELSPEISNLINEMYRSYNIFFAQSVQTPQGEAYVLKIEDCNNWKDIRVAQGDVKVINTFSKL